jgi:Raf kinase inhibitor-like YbhB/YbcL family protein
MKTIERAICLAMFALLAGCGRATPGQPAQGGGAGVNFTLRSPAFAEGETIPVKYTCDGENTPPPLRWEGAPEAQSFVLIVDDPDAPSGTFTHWVLYDVPGAERELPEGLPSVGALGTPGMNDFMQIDYGGPCPPPGSGPHRYFFTLYALDVGSLLTPRGRPRREIEAAMQGHVLGQAKLMGRYERH